MSNNSTSTLYSGPIILPLDVEGKIYALQDRFGVVVGTGSREACEVLIKFLVKPCAAPQIDWSGGYGLPTKAPTA